MAIYNLPVLSTQITHLFHSFLPVDLLSPGVALATDGVSTAGEMYSLICTVSTASNLTMDPVIVWMDSSGVVGVDSDDNISLGNSSSGGEYNVTLTFSSLHTSHGDNYTCMATINIPVAEIDLSSSASETVILKSKHMTTAVYAQISPSHSLPPVPHLVINFTGSPLESPLYAGVNFILTCDIILDPAVDTEVKVTTQWTQDGSVLTNDTNDRIAVFGPTNTGELSYQTQLEFNLLSIANSGEDDGDYTCNVTVTPSQGTNTYIDGVTTVGTRPIQVEG